MLYSTLISAAVLALQFSHTTLAFAIPDSVDLMIRSQDRDDDKIIPFPYDDDDAPQIVEAFQAIEDMPDDVLDKGDKAVKDWINNYRKSGGGGGGNKPRAVDDTLETRDAGPESTAAVDVPLEKRSWLAVAKCALAILQAIAENEFPIAKLRRIKAIVKLLGGAKKTAKMLLKAKSLRQLLVIGGPELAELGEILFNFRSIVGACFSF